MSFLRFSILLMVSFLLLQCDRDNVSDQELKKLEEAKKIWIASKNSNYSFNYLQSCFCAYVAETTIIVMSDTVHAVLNAETGEEVIVETENGEKPIQEVWPGMFPTIDELFAILEHAANEADYMKGSYDATQGMPISVDIDYYRNAIDDEVYYSLGKYRKLSPSAD